MIRIVLVAVMLVLAAPALARAADNPGFGPSFPTPAAEAPAANASADVDPNSFGPPPTSCAEIVGHEGCWANWPNSMPDTWVGGWAVDTDVVRLGQTLKMTAWGVCCGAGWDWPFPGCVTNAPTCEFTPTAPSTRWEVVSMPFSNIIGPASESHYFAVVGSDWFAIKGTVKRRAPATGEQVVAPGVTITATGADGTHTTVTNGAGVYTLWVRKGSHSIAVDGGGSRYCEVSRLPGACVSHVTRDVEGDITVDWRQAPFHHVRGTVKSADDEAVAGAVIRVRPASTEAGSTVMATSEDDGSYDAEAQQGAVIVDSTDPTLCVKGEPKPPGDECARSKPIDLHSNVRVDFERSGCAQTVDFASNMIAKSDCFDILEAGKRWETSKPFWMNGLRLEPSGTVTLDKTLQQITSPAPVDVKLRLPDGTEPTLLPLPALALAFTESAAKFLPGTYTASNDPKVGGLAIDGTVALKWGPGTTTLELSLALSDLQWELDDKLAGSLVKNNKDGITVRGIAENDYGLRRLEGTFALGREVILPPGGSKGGKTKFFKLKELSGAYDFPKHVWRFGGKFEAAFLSGKPAGGGAFADALPIPEVTGTLDVDGNLPFFPQYVTGTGDNINRQLPYGFFLQRVRFSVGADALTPDSPAALSIGVGISLLPHTSAEKTKLPFEEVASVDADLTLSDADLDISTLGDVALKGEGSLKVIDYELLHGTVELYPGQASLVVEGDAKLEIPIDFGLGKGTAGLSGHAAAWFDGIEEEFAAEGNGHWTLPALGSLGVRWAATRSGIAACYTDKPASTSVGIGGVSVDGDTELDLYGITYDWATGKAEIGGCNLEPFTRPRPTARRSAAGAPRTVVVARGTRSLGVQVTGAQRVEVRGPSGKVTVDAARGAKTRWLHALPGATTFVLIKPKAGRYTIRPLGSGRITDLKTATAAPAPEVSGELAGTDCAPVLRWSARRVAGQQIRLLDAGEQSVRVLGTSSRGSGSVKVTSGAGRRTLIAQVLQGGVVRTATVLASYDAPTGTPSAPSRLRVATAGSGRVKLTWRAACGAAFYTVAAGRAKPVVVRGTSRTLKTSASEVTVTAVAPSGTPGGSVTRSLRPSAR